MKKILSYCFFGGLPTYWRRDVDERGPIASYGRYLPVLARVHRLVWPGWELRIHHDDCVEAELPYWQTMKRLEDVTLVPCGEPQSIARAMLWRYKPIFDEDDAVVVCQDLDSLPGPVLRLAVREFLASGKVLQAIHGCESHEGVLGGTTVVRSRPFRRLVGSETWHGFISLAGAPVAGSYSIDEDYLTTVVWPRVRDQAVLYRLGGGESKKLQCEDIRRSVCPGSLHLDEETFRLIESLCPYIGGCYDVEHAAEVLARLDHPAVEEIRRCESA